ncbi:MAG TPA: PleD family two-component system response regulator [Beijerinckia sp.]|jgi:two-component system cell cycle response regulator|nr:PleD family two-component system response regulator [Beijerinckia sp.]
MTARVLVVDDILPNRKLLEARLTAEYFDVLTVANGPQALAVCEKGGCDIVLLDVMMPGMDGFEVCRRLKQDPRTMHIPVVMVTALDQAADRVRGLEAGADDFLTKPIDEIALMARVHSLSRLRLVLDELRTRAQRWTSLGMADPLAHVVAASGTRGRILLVDDRASTADQIATALRGAHDIEIEINPQEALRKGSTGNIDLFIVSLGLQAYDGLRLCSQIQAGERTRPIPVLAIAEREDRQRILRALDLGVNDYLLRPVDRNELIARVRTQLRRKRYADSLRENVEASIEMALVDPLTGLNNRRYLETHLTGLVEQAAREGRRLSLMILDIDHFKLVNDVHGHDAGDEVLKYFAGRVKQAIRTGDLICRLGGEEFVVVMPDTDLVVAARIAERVRSNVEKDVFAIFSGKQSIPVTVSIGLAERGLEDRPEGLFRRADKALYRSKQSGRNRVSADAA